MIDVVGDGVQVDTPLDCRVLVLLPVGQVVRDEVRDSSVLELFINKINSCFFGFSNNVQALDLSNARQSLRFVFRRSSSWCGVQTDQTSDTIREEGCSNHRCLSSNVVSNQSHLLQFSLISKPDHIRCHLFISHAFVMI